MVERGQLGGSREAFQLGQVSAAINDNNLSRLNTKPGQVLLARISRCITT